MTPARDRVRRAASARNLPVAFDEWREPVPKTDASPVGWLGAGAGPHYSTPPESRVVLARGSVTADRGQVSGHQRPDLEVGLYRCREGEDCPAIVQPRVGLVSSRALRARLAIKGSHLPQPRSRPCPVTGASSTWGWSWRRPLPGGLLLGPMIFVGEVSQGVYAQCCRSPQPGHGVPGAPRRGLSVPVGWRCWRMHSTTKSYL